MKGGGVNAVENRKKKQVSSLHIPPPPPTSFTLQGRVLSPWQFRQGIGLQSQTVKHVCFDVLCAAN